ncbi:E3 ubiquitin-protein ligase AIP2 [Vitis vinifera]|uniref:RING-type E3 ubiquitin transferase n=1 Tax=Vitis vinifera TaxID=29760 RepID=A0A438K8A2_VITVI|nr:E3 ubiquitin-protein ligase AIP2 [Vitis vinifera]
MASSSEENLKQQLQELQKQLGKKQMFEEAVLSIKSLLVDHYSSSSPSLRKLDQIHCSRVLAFWLRLFEQAESMVTDSSEKENLKSCIAGARQQLNHVENLSEASETTENRANRGYLFEGHLTVDPEPPRPQWLVQSNNLLTAAATLSNLESANGLTENNNITSENAASILLQLMDDLQDIVPEILDNDTRAPRVPPASKEVVANLPVITLTEDALSKLSGDAECAICKENFVVDDKMQELPCKHTFHPPCLKPWLDKHNSCPICRHELLTDDRAYESWKQREKEAEEERKGAANAVRGGEYIMFSVKTLNSIVITIPFALDFEDC